MGMAERLELPEKVEELKQLVRLQAKAYDELSAEHTELSTEHARLATSYTDLTAAYDQKSDAYERKAHDYLELNEKYEILRNAYFGRSSEKWSVDERLQSSLFNEAELASDSSEGGPTVSADVVTYTVTRKRRGKRLPIPEAVPREEIIHDIGEEDKICGCGAPLTRIGEEQSEKLEIIPAQIKAIRIIRPKYACHVCEGSGDEDTPAVRIAPPPAELLPKSIASAGLVSHIIIGKYCDALPLYRQEKIFRRIGVEISRASMARWIITLAGRLKPLLNLMDATIRSGPLVQMDETRIQVHREPGRENHCNSYMWVARGGPPEKPLIRYHYYPSRGQEVPTRYLTGYRGYLQTDGYAGYEQIAADENITHVLCLAHARRKFDEATKVSGGSPAAREFIALIQRIYRVERELREQDLSNDEFLAERQTQTEPLLDNLKQRLEKKERQVPPSTALGKAVSYTLKALPKIQNYLDLACLTPDNNAAERAIRPFVIGRKNWLHADTPSGAHASAAFYSLIESAKSASLDPYWYIRYLLQHLPKLEKTADWQSMLPAKFSAVDLLTPSS
jgi:transposase